MILNSMCKYNVSTYKYRAYKELTQENYKL